MYYRTIITNLYTNKFSLLYKSERQLLDYFFISQFHQILCPFSLECTAVGREMTTMFKLQLSASHLVSNTIAHPVTLKFLHVYKLRAYFFLQHFLTKEARNLISLKAGYTNTYHMTILGLKF